MSWTQRFGWSGAAFALAVMLSLGVLTQSAAAATTKTSGATSVNVPLNTNITTGTNTGTALGDVTLTCGTVGDVASSATAIVLSLSTATFRFDGTPTPTATKTGTVVVTSPGTYNGGLTTVTFAATTACAVGDTVTISGIKVKAVDATADDSTVVITTAGGAPTIALVPTNGFYKQTTGEMTAVTVPASSVVTVEQSGANAGFASGTFTATTGTFASNAATTLVCADNTACDTNAVVGAIAVSYIAPASGSATIVSSPSGGTSSPLTINIGTPTPEPGSVPRGLCNAIGRGSETGQQNKQQAPAFQGVAEFCLFVYSGPVTDLPKATGCPAATSAFWTTVAGSFIGYVPGTTIAVVNEAFHARFTGGGIPANTPLIARCS